MKYPEELYIKDDIPKLAKVSFTSDDRNLICLVGDEVYKWNPSIEARFKFIEKIPFIRSYNALK